MWDHFVLYQYLCVTTLYCTVYLISTYVGPLCIAKVGIYLISRPTCMCDHFVLHCDCLPHQYLCGTTLYCISTYVGPLCVVLFTSSVPMWDHFALQYICTTLYCVYFTRTTLYCTVYLISTYVGPLCVVLFTSSVPMWDHFALHQYLCGTTLYCTVYFTSTYWDHFVLQQYVYTSSVGLSACVTTLYCTVTVYLINTYVGLLCIASVPMWDHFVLYCLPHQYLCGTSTLYCIARLTSSVPMWDHFVLYQYLCGTTLYYCLPHQYLCGTTLYCSTMCDHFVLHCLPHQYLCGTTLYCKSRYIPSRPTCMCDHFVLHCDCLPHQYLCGTTLYCISTYVGPLCVVLFTSSVPMWDHFALHQYLCGTTLYCTVYFTSTYLDHFVLQQ